MRMPNNMLFLRWAPFLLLLSCKSYPEATTSELFPYYEFAQNSGYRMRLGYMDRSGQRVLGAEFEAAFPFSDGLGCVQVKTDEGRRWGYIDSTGNRVIEAKFSMARPFREGRAWVCDTPDKCGLIDRSGGAITRMEYDRASSDFRNGRCYAYKYVGQAQAGKLATAIMKTFSLGIADGKGTKFYDVYEVDRHGKARLVLESTPRFDHADSITAALQNDRVMYWETDADGFRTYGYKRIWPGTIDHQTLVEGKNYENAGEVVIPPQFKHAERFFNGIARVNTGPGQGALIDTSGNVILAFEDDFQRQR